MAQEKMPGKRIQKYSSASHINRVADRIGLSLLLKGASAADQERLLIQLGRRASTLEAKAEVGKRLAALRETRGKHGKIVFSGNAERPTSRFVQKVIHDRIEQFMFLKSFNSAERYLKKLERISKMPVEFKALVDGWLDLLNELRFPLSRDKEQARRYCRQVLEIAEKTGDHFFLEETKRFLKARYHYKA